MTMPRKRRVTAALTVLGSLAALTLAACAPGGSGDGETVRVYSARHYDLESAFEKYHEETGVKVEFLFGSDAELRERIAAEGENTEADLYLTVDAGNLAAAADQGIFAPLEDPELTAAVPENLRDPQNRWFGLAKRVRTIVYSPERVQPSELSTYEALADPAWKGRLCLRTANASYTQSLVASMIETEGAAKTEEVAKGWADNGQIFANDREIISNIASGKCDVGIVNHYYLAQMLADDPSLPVALIWANQNVEGPTRGVHVNLSGGGVVANADDPEQARDLLVWLATEGQDDLVDGNFEYPVNPKATPVEILTTWGPFIEQPMNAGAYASHNAEAIELLARAGYK